jgi:hypothetical protein
MDVHYREYGKNELLYLLKESSLKPIKIKFLNFDYPGLGWIVKITDWISLLWPSKKRNIVLIAQK